MHTGTRAAAAEAAGVAAVVGDDTAVAAGDVPEGQRPQVAAQ